MDSASWKPLYKTGAIAALVAALLFRRNIGAEVSLFTGMAAIPRTALEWFGLLRTSPFVGMSFLAIFDLAHYFLEGLIFLALAAAYWKIGTSRVALALACGFVGIAVSFSTNTSLSMLSLSQQYFAASTEAQQASLLSAGQALLAFNGPMRSFPGTGAYLTYLLIALAGLVLSSLLLASHRTTAIVGFLAASGDLAYCLTFAFSPLLQAILLSFGGALWMIWHLLVARILFQHSKE